MPSSSRTVTALRSSATGYLGAGGSLQLGQLPEPEIPMWEAGMGDGQLGLLHDAVAEADNVQVQRPGAPPNQPLSAAFPLDRMQVIEEGGWLERGLEQHHLIQVGALRNRSERSGLLDARNLDDPTVREGGEPVACVRQMRRAIAHVRPERHVHPF